MKFPPSMEDLRKIREQVEAVGRSFTKPDDDWSAVCFLFNDKGVNIAGIDMSEKDAVPAMLTMLARKTKAIAGAMITSIWHTPVDASNPLHEIEIGLINELGVRNHPDRKEAVQLELFDGKDTEIWFAPINRFPDKPPTLGEWEKQELANGSGRFANLMERCIGKQRS